LNINTLREHDKPGLQGRSFTAAHYKRDDESIGAHYKCAAPKRAAACGKPQTRHDEALPQGILQVRKQRSMNTLLPRNGIKRKLQDTASQ
jgi:hypothetical protein